MDLKSPLVKLTQNDIKFQTNKKDHFIKFSKNHSSLDEISNNISDPSLHSDKLYYKNDILCTIMSIGSAVTTTCMIGFCKLVYTYNPMLTGLDYLLVRCLPIVLLAFGNVLYQKVDMLDVKPGYRLLMLGRCFIGTLNMLCFFGGLKYIPSSKATLITNISPLLVAIMSYFILKEDIYKSTIIALLGSFIGVTLFSLHRNESTRSNDQYVLGICLALTSSCSLSSVVIILRKLNQEVHHTLPPLYFGLTMMIVAMLILLIYPSLYNFKSYRFLDIVLFVISGIFNYLGQACKSLALKYGNASFVAPFNYLQVVLLLICDLALFGYTFTLIDYIGVAITLSCVSFPVFQKLINSRKTLLKD